MNPAEINTDTALIITSTVTILTITFQIRKLSKATV